MTVEAGLCRSWSELPKTSFLALWLNVSHAFRYCGVSYLIHSEIKALEKKVKHLEKQLENFQGSQEREAKLKEELLVLQEQRGEFEMTITVKDAA